MNAHNFEFDLPLNPTDSATLKLDGVCLEGITSVRIQAGVDGYTNVLLQMTGHVAAKMVADLSVDITEPEFFAAIYDEASKEFPVFTAIALDGCDKHDFISKVIALTIQRANSLR